eukprot:3890854-Pyramimonas_sp.AAC.1
MASRMSARSPISPSRELPVASFAVDPVVGPSGVPAELPQSHDDSCNGSSALRPSSSCRCLEHPEVDLGPRASYLCSKVGAVGPAAEPVGELRLRNGACWVSRLQVEE